MEDDKQVKRLSKAAIAEYQEKLDTLKNVTRLEIAEQIKEARAFGDISENAEYDAAMEHQARVEYEIVQLEELLANVEEIDEENVDTSSVNVGARVRVTCLDDNITEEYDIVSTSEAEPFGRKVEIRCNQTERNETHGWKEGDIVEATFPPKVSIESPLGRSLLGSKPGTTVTVSAPHKQIQYRIEDILKAPDVPQGRVISEKIVY